MTPTRAEAFRFYEKVLKGRITDLITHAETPAAEHVAPEFRDKIIHARLVAGDAILMGGDMPTPDPAHRKGFSVNIQLKDEAEGERIFKALSDGGSVAMPFEKTFWAAKFGMVTDRYGTPWMVNCDASH